MILLPWSYDMMSLLHLMHCGHKNDSISARTFVRHDTQQMILNTSTHQHFHPHRRCRWRYIVVADSLSQESHCSPCNTPLHIWNSIQFQSHLGNTLCLVGRPIERWHWRNMRVWWMLFDGFAIAPKGIQWPFWWQKYFFVACLLNFSMPFRFIIFNRSNDDCMQFFWLPSIALNA